jgi:LemA protein
MDILLYVVIGALGLWAIAIYNLLIRDKHRCAAAWSDIEVQLKRRHDLIPKLVDAVKQYVAYEQATLSAVTELRIRASDTQSVKQLGEIETELGGGIAHLIAVAEQYPDLKADKSFIELQNEISEVEDYIQYARRYYNGAVRNLNTRIDSFPDTLIASGFRFEHWEYFQAE